MGEKIKEYTIYVGMFVCVLLSTMKCSEDATNRVKGEVDLLEKQYKRKIELINTEKNKVKKLKDSLHIDNSKKDSEIAKLKSENKVLDDKITALTAKHKGDIAKVRNYTYDESVKFLVNRYNSPNSISNTNKEMVLRDSIPNLVVKDIVERDFMEQRAAFTEEKLDNLYFEVGVLEKKVVNKDLEIETINELSLSKDGALISAEELNKKYKKENRNLRLGNTITKVLVGVAFAVGFIIAK